MNRRELVLAVAAQTETDKKTVDAIIAGTTDVITAVVSKGEPVTISGFAKFAKAERAARMGRNPATGEAIKIKASKKARITPLKAFKDAVIKPSEAPKLAKGVWPLAPAAPAAKKTATTTARATKSTATKASTKPAKATTAKATAKKVAAKPAAKKATAKKAVAKKTTARR